VNIKICTVLTGKNFKESKTMINEAERAKADMLELRIDYLNETYNFADIRSLTDLPLIATNRPHSEGGFFNRSEKERIKTLFAAAEVGFEYVDLELSTSNLRNTVKRFKRLGSEVIVSSHNFKSTPPVSAIYSLFQRELASGADICKVVMTAKTLEDNLTCLKFVSSASKKRRVVAFCMGDLGASSRILSPLFGVDFTYASVRRGRESASGQLTVRSMRRIYEIMGMKDEGRWNN